MLAEKLSLRHATGTFVPQTREGKLVVILLGMIAIPYTNYYFERCRSTFDAWLEVQAGMPYDSSQALSEIVRAPVCRILEVAESRCCCR